MSSAWLSEGRSKYVLNRVTKAREGHAECNYVRVIYNEWMNLISGVLEGAKRTNLEQLGKFHRVNAVSQSSSSKVQSTSSEIRRMVGSINIIRVLSGSGHSLRQCSIAQLLPAADSEPRTNSSKVPPLSHPRKCFCALY